LGLILVAKKRVVLEGEAKIGKINMPMFTFSLSPEDLSSPLALQMALSKIMESLMNAMEKPMNPRYMAEVRFKDSTGNPISVALDLGESLPPFSKDKVKAKIIIELYENEEDEVPDLTP